jgi:hypothetical protein
VQRCVAKRTKEESKKTFVEQLHKQTNKRKERKK